MTDLQPTLDAIAKTAARLCDAKDAMIWQVEGDQLRLVAKHGPMRTTFAPGELRPISRGTFVGRAVVDRKTLHIRDMAVAVRREFKELASRQRATGLRTVLSTPLLRDGVPLGVISIRRTKVRLFTASQIALLQMFADQAAIAIEKARLAQELAVRNRDLTEALEQQTATSEILRVISSSPTDVQPVFNAIARSGARLCDAAFGAVFRFDGDLINIAAHHNWTPEILQAHQQVFPMPPHSQSLVGRAILERRIVHVHDITSGPGPEYPYPAIQRVLGARTNIFVPMLREEQPLGVIVIYRQQVQPFSENQIALLQTFADQAVIAIENVRLFTELQEKNRALTQALEQQTATSEVLKVISRSAFELEPVLHTLVENAARLCSADSGQIRKLDGEVFRTVAAFGMPSQLEEFDQQHPARLGRGTIVGRTALEGRTVHIPDVLGDPEYQWTEAQKVGGYRTLMGVPMLREGALIGVFVLHRFRVEPFTDKQIELVTTFADQAVIAIENVRLFQELEARTRELTRSVDELKALGEVSRAVSSTLDVETVLQTIVSRAQQLAGAEGCSIFEYDEATEEFHLRATQNYDIELVEAARAMPLRRGEGVIGLAAERREPIQVSDIAQEGVYQSRLRDILLRMGYRALLAVPLVRDEQIIGALSVNRKMPGEFGPEVIELLKTFATQSALAIQNARLFREIGDKSRQLEAASRHKSEFLANMSHELRTPLNAIIGFSEVLAERMFGEVNEKQAEYLQDIHASGRHLLSLINDILDLSKVEAGRLELELAAFNLPVAVENALILVRERAFRHGISLAQAVDERVGDIMADERKVKQILLNLLSNAVKFTPEGGRIVVTATPAGGVIEIAVSDTGIGIAPEDQAAIFEEFRQVGRDDARKQEGTGLGLTLAKKFVELHGGQMWVQSQVGQGSTFRFTLPVRPEGRSSRA